MAAFLYRHFPPQSSPLHPLDLSLQSQQQSSPWDCSTVPKLQLPAAALSRGLVSLSRVYIAAARTVWFSFHLAWHNQLFHCSSSDSDTCPDVGIGLLPRAGPGLLTLLFFPLVPSSYWVFHGSVYSFPLVRYSCPLWAGVLHALLCLKGYSWYICGERCIPCPPTPSPSCSFLYRLFDDGHSDCCEVILHCSFDLHFSNNERCGVSFQVFISHLWRNVCLGLLPTFWLGCSFFWYWAACATQYIGDSLSVVSFTVTFSHSEGCFHLAYGFLHCAKAFKFN